MAKHLIDGPAPLTALDMRNGDIHVYSDNCSRQVCIKIKAAKDDIRLQSLYDIRELRDIARERA